MSFLGRRGNPEPQAVSPAALDCRAPGVYPERLACQPAEGVARNDDV